MGTGFVSETKPTAHSGEHELESKAHMAIVNSPINRTLLLDVLRIRYEAALRMSRRALAAMPLVLGLLAEAAYGDPSSTQVYRLAGDRGCLMCHEVESRAGEAHSLMPVAPAFQDIARRYRGDRDAAGRLTGIVREGSGPLHSDRHWAGKVQFDRMYPNDILVSEAEARRIVEWILTLAPARATGDKAKAKRTPPGG